MDENDPGVRPEPDPQVALQPWWQPILVLFAIAAVMVTLVAPLIGAFLVAQLLILARVDHKFGLSAVLGGHSEERAVAQGMLIVITLLVLSALSAAWAAIPRKTKPSHASSTRAALERWAAAPIFAGALGLHHRSWAEFEWALVVWAEASLLLVLSIVAAMFVRAAWMSAGRSRFVAGVAVSVGVFGVTQAHDTRVFLREHVGVLNPLLGGSQGGAEDQIEELEREYPIVTPLIEGSDKTGSPTTTPSTPSGSGSGFNSSGRGGVHPMDQCLVELKSAKCKNVWDRAVAKLPRYDSGDYQHDALEKLCGTGVPDNVCGRYYVTIQRQIVNEYRRANRLVCDVSPDDSPCDWARAEDQLAQHESIWCLNLAMDRLDSRQKKLLDLRYGQDLSWEMVAVQDGALLPDSARRACREARETLKEEISKLCR
jgi:hypothetical protein